ncbi:siderophore ABC transporter substrate-binding protein [Aestuariimicrobium sp. Y1814]|uniref:siderophore ABC transporter substrate-binding protein n=1 Tax=Aestuariimicrobium sp. Y1814 TaxID=3418742 RepID=UPI003DA6FA86
MQSASPLAKGSRWLVALVAAAAVALTGCGASDQGDQAPVADDTRTSVTITDNGGEKTIELPITSYVALDNRTFQTLQSWGLKPAAAARALMPTTNPWKTDESIVDIGNHREPNLELIAAAQPQVIISGQRFTQFNEKIAELVPDAIIIDLDPREGEPFDKELERQTTVLGEIFNKQDEAAGLNAELDAAITRAKDAYDPDTKVMAINASGGNLGFIAPGAGRTLGPVFDILGLTPALEVEGSSDDHEGDDISVEAIAKSNPDLIMVMDRDAAVTEPGAEYTPAAELIANSAALQNVSAVKTGNIVIMPADTYTNEGVQTYTTFFNSLADQLEKKA